MFEEFRRAWREAVENFRRELHAAEPAAGSAAGRLAGMRRDLSRVRGEATRLADEALRARREAGAEREQVEVCHRRETLARGIGDLETAKVAAGFAARHAERAALLERKAELFEAEARLLEREAGAMAVALQESAAAPSAAPPPPDADDTGLAGFRDLEQTVRERAIDARLEELKRRMR